MTANKSWSDVKIQQYEYIYLTQSSTYLRNFPSKMFGQKLHHVGHVTFTPSHFFFSFSFTFELLGILYIFLIGLLRSLPLRSCRFAEISWSTFGLPLFRLKLLLTKNLACQNMELETDKLTVWVFCWTPNRNYHSHHCQLFAQFHLWICHF